MDDIVLRAMAKWPNVPAVYGWLSLTRRGEWFIKDERVTNPMVSAFIARNYGHDEHGRWFFQNGPQRVFVALDYTPLVYRVVNAESAPLAFACHTGKPVATVRGIWLDEQGTPLLETEHGVGVVRDRDLEHLFPQFIDVNGSCLDENALCQLTEMLQRQREAPLWLRFGVRGVRIEPIRFAEVPGRFGFVRHPREEASEERAYAPPR